MPPIVNSLQPDIMIGTLFINYGNFGWSERYMINALTGTNPVPSYTVASTQFNNIINNRANLLGAGMSIVWGRLSLASRFGDSVPALSGIVPAGKVDGESTVEVCNRPEDAFLFRFDDMAGKRDQRVIRGLRDGWIADAKQLNALPTTLPVPGDTAKPTESSGFLTPGNAIFNFLLSVITNSVIGTPNKGTNAGTWNTVAIQKVTYRGTTTRQTGRPFALSRGRAPSRV